MRIIPRGEQSFDRFHMRLAERNDIPRIKAFYLERMSSAGSSRRSSFPVPDLREIAESVADSDCLVVEEQTDREIVAVAALLRLVRHDNGTFAELGGMAVAPRAGGFEPHTLQSILLAVRIVRRLSDLLAERGGMRLVAFVHADNERSRAALEKACLVRLIERPRWLAGEFISWFGWDHGSEWQTYLVGGRAACDAARLIDTIEQHDRSCRLTRRDRHSDRPRQAMLTFAPELWASALPDIRTLLSDGPPRLPSLLPDTVSFGDPPRRR